MNMMNIVYQVVYDEPDAADMLRSANCAASVYGVIIIFMLSGHTGIMVLMLQLLNTYLHQNVTLFGDNLVLFILLKLKYCNLI